MWHIAEASSGKSKALLNVAVVVMTTPQAAPLEAGAPIGTRNSNSCVLNQFLKLQGYAKSYWLSASH